MNHKSENTHHGGTAVVKLDGTLGKLGLFIEGVPAKVKGSVTEVTNEFTSSDILHYKELKETNKGEDLGNTSIGHGLNSGPSIGDRVEGSSIIRDVSREVDTSTSDDVSKESKLGDTAVLELNVTKTVEAGLVGIIEETEGVEESKRRLGTEFGFEGLEGGRGLGNLGRSEGGGRGGKGGDDGELHVVRVIIFLLWIKI